MDELFDPSKINLSPNYESTPVIKASYSRWNDLKKQPTSLSFTTPIDSLRKSSERNEYRLNSPLAYSMPSSGRYDTTSPTAKLSDIDANTVQRQRKELQLMISELKDRDRELNDMVHSHHNQLVCWEVDRQRMAYLDKQLSKAKVELKRRGDKCKLLKERLQLCQNGVQSKNTELEATQLQLRHISEKAKLSSNQVGELKTKNNKLQLSVRELSNSVGSLQSREQEVNVLLKLKDKDIEDANKRIVELTERLQATSKSLSEYKKADGEVKTKLEKKSSENVILKKELDNLKSPVNKYFSPERCEEEISSLKQNILLYQKELILAGEREKRKDSLLELSRSKQERTESELKQLRQLYTDLQKQYLTTKKLLDNQDERGSIASDLDDRDLFMSNSLDKLCMLQSSNENRHFVLQEEKKFTTSPADEAADISLQSLESDDIGAMTTGELKSNDLMSYWEVNPSNGNTIQNESISPTSHLHILLAQSRQMVQHLESCSTFASNQSTPEDKKP